MVAVHYKQTSIFGVPSLALALWVSL